VSGIRFEERGTAEFKGFEQPVELLQAVSLIGQRLAVSAAPPALRALETAPVLESLPAELDPITPMVDRDHEVHWISGTWRQARRGRGRLIFVSGPAGIGKTRLIAELAGWVHASSGRVQYAGAGGAGTALALAAIRETTEATDPTLLVVNDLEALGATVIDALDVAAASIAERPVMIVGAFRDARGFPALASLVESVDEHGDGHRSLAPLDVMGVADVVRLYAGREVEEAPVESMWRASGGIPSRVHEVVSEWARDEAKRRLAAAAEWLAAGRSNQTGELEFANNVIALKLGRLYDVDTAGAVPASEVCPYKGLAAFEVDDAPYFFGRERLVGELAARTVGVGLLGLVGPSGSGKSSAVLAGLVPSLAAGLLPGSERWRSVLMRPGEHPIQELRSALGSFGFATTAGDDLVVSMGQVEAGGRLVLLVDQFEELFTTTLDALERDAFVEALVRAATQDHERVLVVLTIRADFYGDCAEYPELAQLLAANHVLVGTMSVDELRRSIELPARRVGLRVESALSHALVDEVTDEPGGLPLLSTALVELWGRRESGWVRMGTYERSGGLRGAVARLAERSYQQLTDAERQIAKTILLRLVGSGEGEAAVRRRVSIAEFDPDHNTAAAAVLDRLTQDRLLTRSDGLVEIAHEALIREWPRLRDWLEEDVQGRAVRAHLTEAAKQWQEADRDPGELYRGPRLSVAMDWAATHANELNELERKFVSESRQASQREAERQRRTNRRLRGLLVGVAGFLVVALVAGSLALVQRGRAREEAARAERQSRVASARELAAAAVANQDVDPERSILLALEAVNVTWKADRTVVPEAEEALHRALQESRVLLTVPQGGGIDVSADGSRFGTTGQDGTATVWGMDTGERLLTLEGHRGVVNDIAFSPDGSRLATTGSDGTVRVWDGASGRQIHVLRGHQGVVWGVAFSPAGRLLATSSEDATVRIWDVAAGTEEMVLTGPDGATFDLGFLHVNPVFSPDGSRVASGSWDKAARIWDLRTSETSVVLAGHVFGVTAVAFSPDGSRVATGSPEGTARIWDAESGELLTTFSGHTGEVLAFDYSPDGSRIATGGSDATARVWDSGTGKLLLTLAGHTTGIGKVAFTPDGDRLLTGGADGTTRLWDISLAGGRDWLTVPGPDQRLGGVEFSPDGTSFAVPGQLKGVTIRDVDTGRKLITLEGHDATVMRIAFSPDGTRLAAAAGSGATDSRANRTVPVWDVNTGELVMTLTGHDDEVSAVAFTPDGRGLVTHSWDGTLRVWDAATGTEERLLEVGGEAYALPFSPDGRFLLAALRCDGAVTIWDAATLEMKGQLRGHTDCVQDMAFGPDGQVVTASFDGTAKIWDLESRRELATLRAHSGPVLDVAVSPDGSLVASSHENGTTKLWDATTGREVLTLFGHGRFVHTVAFSPDGRLLATASADGTVALHLLPIDELRELARERVTRTLTDEECRQYLHVEKCPAGI
jgi:WD40 repeat protein